MKRWQRSGCGQRRSALRRSGRRSVRPGHRPRLGRQGTDSSRPPHWETVLRERDVHLVVDRHSAHRSKSVWAWLADHEDRVEPHFLPPYSPELNPDELVNADLKHSLPRQHRARNQAELAAETRRFFRRRLRQPHIIRGYFGGPTVRYVLNGNP
nr:transposase [Streptomyces zhaozhouensis]